jgi:DNA-binding MarR family transcriptional regulator
VSRPHNRGTSAIDGGAALERLFELALLLTDGMERGLAERGLSRARAELLWRLRARSPMTQRELSQELRCTPRNVTDLVDALETAGLVARGPHPTDRRATLVSLTDRGKAVAARLQTEYRQFAAELFRDVPADELAGFVKVVDYTLGRLREAGPAAQGA